MADTSRQEVQGLALERHEGNEPASCDDGGWCCGCDVHPIGKPWGWNYEAWLAHRRRGCRAWPEDRRDPKAEEA